jgi:hypothetical protein
MHRFVIYYITEKTIGHPTKVVAYFNEETPTDDDICRWLIRNTEGGFIDWWIGG